MTASLTEPADDVDRVRVAPTDRVVVRWLIRIVVLGAFIGVWEWYGRRSNPALFAPFSETVREFNELAIQSNELWKAAWDSLSTMLVGFGIAIPVGFVIGLLMGRFRTIEYLLDPYVSFVYALPIVVLVPLMVIWVGIGNPVRILIVFLTAVFPIIINTLVGAKQVEQELVDVARMSCATERQMLRTVFFPSVLPYTFTGIHIGIGSALIGMLLGEMLVVLRGLGGMIVRASNFYQPARVIVPLAVIVAVSLILVGSMGWLRRRLMPWHAAGRH